MARKLLSIEEAAEKLGVSVTELNAMRDRGDIFAVRDGGNWKFKEDEIKRAQGDLEDDGGFDLEESSFGIADEPDSILIGDADLTGDTDSNKTLIGDDKEEAVGSDLELDFEFEPDSSDTAADKPAGDVQETDLGAAFDDFELEMEDEGEQGDKLSLDDEMTVSGDGGSEIDLSGDDDELVLGSSSDSDLTLNAGDSGIGLTSPSDSGLSLSEPLELGGSAVDSFELGEDSKVDLDRESDDKSPTELKASDDFLLTPLEGDDDDSDSGSQVIALDEDDSFDDASLGGDSQALSLDDDDEVGAAAAMGPGSAAAFAVTPTVVEAPYSIWNVLGLACCMLFLLLGGMLMYDLLRHVWSWDQPYTVNTGMMKQIVQWFK